MSDDNIDSVDEYNNRQLKAETILPHILVIIDDITDLLNSKTLDVEEYIYHIIRKQKKTGIHLMLCSKFARSDSFTRMLTYRIPFQISFKAPNRSSKEKGALRIDDSNSLLGRGDALYRIKKISDPIRLQTFCVNFGEIEQVVTYIRETNKHFVPETLLPTIESIARKQFSYSEEGYNDKEVKALLHRIILSLKEPTNDMKDSNQITSKEIEYTILHMSKPGYDTKEVDDYLDYLVQEVRANESKKPFDNEKYTQ